MKFLHWLKMRYDNPCLIVRLSPRNNYTDHYLCVRTWDGYDKPDYVAILKIKPEEKDLNAGRFLNFKQWQDKFYHDKNLVERYIPIGEGIGQSEYIQQKIDEIITSVSNETIDAWSFMVEGFAHSFIILWFSNKSDAVKFKLKYG